jgi:hypothetical protein
VLRIISIIVLWSVRIVTTIMFEAA